MRVANNNQQGLGSANCYIESLWVAKEANVVMDVCSHHINSGADLTTHRDR